jgi:hypothetical protein
MSATKKRGARRSSGTSSPPAAQLQQQHRPSGPTPFVPTPLPDWRWMTVPVFLAFAVGGFIGLELGVVAGSTNNGRLTMAVAVIFALVLGLAFSRIVTRLMISKQWIKPRPRSR